MSKPFPLGLAHSQLPRECLLQALVADAWPKSHGGDRLQGWTTWGQIISPELFTLQPLALHLGIEIISAEKVVGRKLGKQGMLGKGG